VQATLKISCDSQVIQNNSTESKGSISSNENLPTILYRKSYKNSAEEDKWCETFKGVLLHEISYTRHFNIIILQVETK
jgi:hypothetical protein